ncbi:hypothetical protein H6P81_008457 [Aristolochia fimbriata]|uniref:Cytochrome P450 n=1 Tax=Aristolochia fimbriata TaxID=158543 RepID=A0AAV7EI33_ARIFI|nr:hypothetical protein H6P81_008457 [Aristolochia fimbriata]
MALNINVGSRLTSQLVGFLRAYPELLLVVFSVLLVRYSFCRLKKSRVVAIKKWPVLRILANINRVHDWCTELLRKRGGTVVLKGPRFSQMHMLLTCDPENTSYIASRAHFANYPKGDDYAQLFDILGDGILNADSDSWQIQRKWAHRLLRQKGFRHLVAKVSGEKVEKGLIPLLDAVAQKGCDAAVDLQDVFQRYTFDVSGLLMCGVDPGCLYPTFPAVPFVQAMDDANEVILLRHAVPNALWKLQRWLGIGNERKMARARKTIDHVVANLIATRRRELKESAAAESGSERCVDLLTAYMSQPTEDPEMERLKASDVFLRDTILNMLAAGRNTTSAALTWLFWELSRNPRVEEKILHELLLIKTAGKTKKKLGEEAAPGNKAIFKVYEAEEVSGLPYLHATLCECLRLYPSVPLVLKGVEKADTLPSGQRVEPGMRIVVTLYAMGRMESVWGETYLEFNPERWLTDEGNFNYDMLYSKFQVFSTGPRSCLGRDLSFTQMKVVVASLLHNFHVRVVEGQKAMPAVSVTLQMKNGLMVKLARRTSVHA